MKQTVTFNDFYDAFQQVRPDNFTRQGLIVLFDYLEQLEYDTGECMELDVIAICCDHNEATWQEIAEDHNLELDDDLSDEEKEIEVIEYLEGQCVYIGSSAEGLLYREF